MGNGAIAVVGGYLLGSISFSYVIVRVLEGIDIRTVGSGNAGATNVLRAAGPLPAMLALLLDAGKGAGAVLLARLLVDSHAVEAAVGIAAVLGHMFPVFFAFRGGKGVATAAGTMALLAPLATLGSLAVFIAVVAWTRYVSLGSILAAISCPLLVGGIGLAAGETGDAWRWSLIGVVVIASLIVVKHRENIARLRAGTESKFGATAKSDTNTDRGETDP